MKGPIAIIGAGIAGACLAYRLAATGREVLVIDDSRPGRASGWNPGGVNPLHGPGFPGVMTPVYRRAYELHAAQWPEVREASGIDFGWRAIERLFLAVDEQEAGQLRGLADFYTAMNGFSARWLEPAELTRWDARIAPSWAGGLLTFGNVRLDTERYRLALLAAAGRHGARTVTATVERIVTTGERIDALDWGAGAVSVAALCMVAGAWAGTGIGGWEPGTTVPIAPSIGDMLLVRSTDTPPRADVGHGLTAIYQHEGDRYWIGGTTRTGGPLGSATAETEAELIAGARSLLPGWQFETVARSSAARPQSADRLPVVGRAPAFANGWILNGLGGKGVLLSAWAADGLARMIEAGEETAEFAPFSPSRQVE